MRVNNISNYQYRLINEPNENKYKSNGLHNVLFGTNLVSRTLAKARSDSLIFKLPVEYVHELSKSRFYRPNVFIGSALFDDVFNTCNTPVCIEIAKKAGIRTIVDLDNGTSGKYKEVVENAGLEYYSFPVRRCTSEEQNKKVLREELVNFIKKMQEDNIYVGSDSWMSRDTAAYLNFYFNPKFDSVHISTFENVDMNKSLARKMYSYLTDEDKKSIGWTPKYEENFKQKLNL